MSPEAETTPAAPAPKLAVADLSITYVDRAGRKTEAVREVSFEIADKPGAGEIVVFLGPVRAGCFFSFTGRVRISRYLKERSLARMTMEPSNLS